MLIAGVDIGNSTTEICICDVKSNGKLTFEASAMVETTGLKGTVDNIKGIEKALEIGLEKLDRSDRELKVIRLNEATPVIGDTAMETITETIISESTMIGHNPDTPAGEGLAIGKTVLINDLTKADREVPVIALVPEKFDYEKTAIILNTTKAKVVGVILQKDEAVLVYNRLVSKLPIIDEVAKIDELPTDVLCAIEVAPKGGSITALSNPYKIARLFDLSPQETRQVIPVAKSLTGKKSGVVAKTISGGVKEKVLKAGKITIESETGHSCSVEVDEGAKVIMDTVESVQDIYDIHGDKGTYFDEMLIRMKNELEAMSPDNKDDIKIKDLLAIDTFIPVSVKGALAGELAMEKAVAMAAMVKTEQLPMEKLAKALSARLNVTVTVAGIEAVMASVGSLTTKGTQLPLAILDLGGGSTDGAIMNEDGKVISTHLAGAGSFVTMMINEELALNNLTTAELIKRYPLGKVNSLYQITMENGEVIFYKEPLPPKLYAKVVIVKEKELIPVESSHTLEFIVQTRKQVKEKVFVLNSLRALTEIAPDHNIKKIPNVVLVGGSALDREIPEMIQKSLANYNIVAGAGDIWGIHGPRNAVATGLCLSFSKDV